MQYSTQTTVIYADTSSAPFCQHPFVKFCWLPGWGGLWRSCNKYKQSGKFVWQIVKGKGSVI